jgi:hypothetical protein
MKIGIAKTQEPKTRLSRLNPVEILCRLCRLSNQSGVSTFDSNTGANPRLKLEVASILFDTMVGRPLIFPPCDTLQIDLEGPSVRVDEKSRSVTIQLKAGLDGTRRSFAPVDCLGITQ